MEMENESSPSHPFSLNIDRGKLNSIVALAPSLVFLILFIIGSIISMILYVGELGPSLVKMINDRGFQAAYLRTFRMAGIVALVCSLLGYLTAFYVIHLPRNLRMVVRALIFLPVMINPVVRAYGWMIILGRKGLINSILLSLGIIKEPIKLLYTELAAELGLIELFFPFMFIPLLGAMENIDEEIILAARSLGAGTFRLFMDIILPLSFKGYLLGLATVLAGCFSAFTTPSLLGGMRNRTLSMLLFEFISLRLNWSMAAAVALIITASVLIITWLTNIFVKGRR